LLRQALHFFAQRSGAETDDRPRAVEIELRRIATETNDANSGMNKEKAT